MAALRRAGVDIAERHVDVWNGRDHLGPLAALRVASAELKLMIPQRRTFDAVVVGYPGHFDIPQARSIAGPKPLVFLPRISLTRELVERRQRFRPRSVTARVLQATDVRALKLANAVVADTDVAADHLAEVGALPRERVVTIFAGAEERIFREEWSPVYPFGALHVPSAGTSIDTLLDAAGLVPELPVRIVGSELRGAPPNVEWRPTPYDDLGLAFAHAGVAIGGLDESVDIPDGAFRALATGTPLVTADTAAARELLVHEESALLVPAGDAEAVANALRRVAGDARLRLQLSESGRRTYAHRASEGVLGAAWRELLEHQTGIV
jgi:hypothetical protein